MLKKSILRSKEQDAAAASSNHLDGGSSSDDEEAAGLGDDVKGKKLRIPWDRDKRGDKNGLKQALLTVINENRFHVEGKYKDNFKEVSSILSQPGSVFERYHGIEPSGAQRKFNDIVRDITKTYGLVEGGEAADDSEAHGFEALALGMVRDMMEKEKDKSLHRQQNSSKGVLVAGNVGAQGLGRKRKAGMVPLKGALRKAAAAMLGVDGDDDSEVERIDPAIHRAVCSALSGRAATVEDLLRIAGVSAEGSAKLLATTAVHPDRPLDRLLRLYEEVSGARDYVSRARVLLGMGTADALELDALLRPLYEQHAAL